MKYFIYVLFFISFFYNRNLFSQNKIQINDVNENQNSKYIYPLSNLKLSKFEYLIPKDTELANFKIPTMTDSNGKIIIYLINSKDFFNRNNLAVEIQKISISSENPNIINKDFELSFPLIIDTNKYLQIGFFNQNLIYDLYLNIEFSSPIKRKVVFPLKTTPHSKVILKSEDIIKGVTRGEFGLNCYGSTSLMNNLSSGFVDPLGFALNSEFIPITNNISLGIPAFSWQNFFNDTQNNGNLWSVLSLGIGAGFNFNQNISSYLKFAYGGLSAYHTHADSVGVSGLYFSINISYHPFTFSEGKKTNKNTVEEISKFGVFLQYDQLFNNLIPINKISLGISLVAGIEMSTIDKAEQIEIAPNLQELEITNLRTAKENTLVNNQSKIINNEKTQNVSKITGQEKQKYMKIYGVVLDGARKPVVAEIICEDLTNHQIIDSTISSKSDGSYSIIFPYGKFYGYFFKKSGFYSKSKNIDLRNANEYTSNEFNDGIIELTSLDEMITTKAAIRVNNIFFDYNKFEIKKESISELDRLAKFLFENPNIYVEISGHTDNIGNTTFNTQLSKDRANEVVKYLITKGCIRKNLKAVGYGKSRPICDNSTEAGRQLNRRVELQILK